MLNSRFLYMVGLFSFSLLMGCKENNEIGSEVDIVTDLKIIKNPSGYAPLTAEILVNTNTNASVRLRVFGKNGDDSDVVHHFPDFETSFEIPVLGLYPAFANEVELTFLDEDNSIIGSKIVHIQTAALIPDLPQIDINSLSPTAQIDGFYFVNYFGYDEEPFPQRPFMFDKYGDIRWFLNYSLHPTLSNLFYDVGMNRLQNGNLIFGDGNTGALYEVNMFGEIEESWSLQGYGFHHTVIEKSNGNFLVTVNDFSKSTVEDVILEIDRNTHNIVNKWDLNESMDNSRRAWESSLANLDFDWFHANGLADNSSDNAIIASGRTQGVVKLTENNEVIWILAPHKEWGTSGNGTDLNQFLLQPLDAQGMPIEDINVLNGEENHPDFEWTWYQHSPILLANGNLMVFDNGENRNYTINEIYSRAVEYEIDEQNRTIRQVWSYGKERGGETYSRIVSKVVHIEDQNNVLFTPGAVEFDGGQYGKVIEVDRQNGQVLFEATVTPPQTFFIITFHNVQRMPLYPE